MGIAKRVWEEAQNKGFYLDSDTCVCSNCFEDYAIKQFISQNDTNQTCDYCEISGEHSCSLKHVLTHILSCIKTEWGHPANEGLPYETREGGWQGTVYDSWEMLESVGIEVNSESLWDCIRSSLINDEWCRRNPYSLSEDRTLYYGWQAFSKFITTESRYVFLGVTPSDYDEYQHDEMNPIQILESLSDISQSLGLIKSISVSTQIFRVRIVNPQVFLSSASELGSPPVECANIPNRMSPAGISMFYGAFDVETAILETYDPSLSSNKKAIVATFYPVRNLKVLDLSTTFSIPSLFDDDSHRERPWIKFLIDFMKDFTKSISRDDRSHVDYVPTQVVTEYFRHIVRVDGEKLDGVIYPSSKSFGRPAIVIFANNHQCVDNNNIHQQDSLLYLESVTDRDLTNVT